MSNTAARVLYFGYGDLGLRCLNALIEAGVEIVGIIARASDRQSTGDSQSLYSHSLRAGLSSFPNNNPGDETFIEHATALRPDYLISIQYDRILTPALLAVAQQGGLNLHFSPLPRLRGCFPTKWAIINNEESGVTLHRLERGIDDGPIIDQIPFPLRPNETDASLYAALQQEGYELFQRNVQAIAKMQVDEGENQLESSASYYPKVLPHDGKIDWCWSAVRIERFVRAFTHPPHPAAQTTLGDKVAEIAAPIRILNQKSEGLPGAAHLNNEGCLVVATGSENITVDNLLLDGERVQPSAALTNLTSARFR